MLVYRGRMAARAISYEIEPPSSAKVAQSPVGLIPEPPFMSNWYAKHGVATTQGFTPLL